MKFEDVIEALSTLGVKPPVTLKDLKSAYRKAVKQANSDELKKLSVAYKVLVEFIENYPFAFTEDEILKAFPEERLRRRIWNDPLWGNTK